MNDLNENLGGPATTDKKELFWSETAPKLLQPLVLSRRPPGSPDESCGTQFVTPIVVPKRLT